MSAQNLEAEESVLGAMLFSTSAIEGCSELLTPRDFYRESHGDIYNTILSLHAADLPVSAITVADELEKRGKLSQVGGKAKLAELVSLTPAASNAAHYAKIIRELSVVRGLLHAGQEIQKLATTRDGDLDLLLAKAEQALTEVTMRHDATVAPLTDGLEELLGELRLAYSTGTPMTGEPTGFKDLDAMLLGLWPGQLVICAARPSQGKSTLALNIAENFCDRGVATLFMSLEMGRREFQLRSLARAARIDGLRLASGTLTEEEAARLKLGVETVRRRSNMHLEEGGAVTVQQLAATAARLVRTHQVGLVVVDYIQLMSQPNAENRTNEVGAISRGLKLLARKLDVPVLALSQMSRAIESRSEKRPTLSDLRESGSLEQDADVVMFIHDESAYDADKPPSGTVEVIVAKNRRGPTDSVKMLYTRRLSSFYDNNTALKEAAAA